MEIFLKIKDIDDSGRFKEVLDNYDEELNNNAFLDTNNIVDILNYHNKICDFITCVLVEKEMCINDGDIIVEIKDFKHFQFELNKKHYNLLKNLKNL